MDRKTLGRLARLEQGRVGAPEFWIDPNDGSGLIHRGDGRTMAREDYRLAFPHSEAVTFRIDKANEDAGP